MPKHKVRKLHQNVIDQFHDADQHDGPSHGLDCVAAFYRDGEVRLYSRNAAEASESNAPDIEKRYNNITTNAQATSGLAVSKVNPWTFVYTIGGRTYEITIP